MFIYINKSDNIIFYKSEGEVRTDDNMIYGPTEIIRKSSNSYKIREVNSADVDLKYFSEHKYMWDSDASTVSYVYPESETEDKRRDIRLIRDPILEQTDIESNVLWADRWMAQDSDTRAIWTNYRQELRDIANIENPDTIEWPTHPLEKGGALNPILEDSA